MGRYTQHIDLDVKSQLDAGDRLRVSQITTQIDIKQIHDLQPLFYDRENVGGATQVYSSTDSGVTMSVTSDGDVAIAESKEYGSYFAGKSQFIELTFDDMGHQEDVVKRVGYFRSNTSTPFDSDKDGMWLESDGTDFRFRIQKEGTDILNVIGSDWNINSSATEEINPDAFNVLVIQFLYLGGTAVKFGFFVDGNIRWAHKYVHAGEIESTFIKSPNQPVRYEIRSTGGAGSFHQNCAHVASEGSLEEAGVNTEIDMQEGTLTAATSGTFYAMAGARLKDSYKDVMTKLSEINVLGLSNNDYYHWELRLNPTVTGTFTYSDITDSALQGALGNGTQTVTGGHSLAVGKGVSRTSLHNIKRSELRLGNTIGGVEDELVLCITPIAGTTNLVCSGGFLVEEFL